MRKIINAVILTIYLIISTYLIISLNEFLTINELIIITIFLVTLELLFIYLLKNNILIYFSYPCLLFVLICLFLFNIKSENIISFTTKIQENKLNNYYLIVNKEKYNNINDLADKNIGYLNTFFEFTNLNIDYDSICYQDINLMLNDLKNNKLDAAIISDYYYASLDLTKYKKIKDLEFVEEIIPTTKNSSNTILIYIVADDINLNCVFGLNKDTEQLLIIGIPDNYYVNFKNEKDIFSNINKYGIKESINVVSNMLENNIDYYIEIDSKNLEDLIDEIGGIDVISEYNFISLGNEFNKGANHLNGKETIVFANYVDYFHGGSRVKNDNQVRILKSLINKLAKEKLYFDYLNEISNTIKTNIPSAKLLRFLKDRITYDSSWNITSYLLDGSDEYEYTYSSKCCKLGIIDPDVMTINNAITSIEYLKSNSVFH